MVAAAGIRALWLGLERLLATNRGLDLTDEGLYLLAAIRRLLMLIMVFPLDGTQKFYSGWLDTILPIFARPALFSSLYRRGLWDGWLSAAVLKTIFCPAERGSGLKP